MACVVPHTVIADSSLLESDKVWLLGGELAGVGSLRSHVLHLDCLRALQYFERVAFRGAHPRGGASIFHVLLDEVGALLR